MRYLATLLMLLLACCPSPQKPTGSGQSDTTLKPLAESPLPESGQSVSFGRDVLPLFSSACLSCHNPEHPGGSYTVNSHCDVFGPGTDSMPNVIPGKPESSLLYTYLLKGHPAHAPLDSARLRVVRNWIEQGARNN